MSDKVFIIAEAGANHNRNFEQAKALIDSAREAGADACKFQTYSSETLYSKGTPDFAGYKNINKLIKEIELPREWQKGLKSYCDDVGIEFMSTPFDERAVEELLQLGVKRLKIAGFESTDPRFVRMVASAGLPIVVSSGIGNNLSSASNILSWVRVEQQDPDVTVLHCNNAYPTPDNDINLSNIEVLKKIYPNVKIGLSDHTSGTMAPMLAVAKGAVCIEKHFTLSKRLPGPDHPFALEPDELKEMVSQIRRAETMCTISDDKLTSSEKRFSNAMRSVIVSGNVKGGDLITKDNITTKRPLLDNSIPADRYYGILGKRFSKDLSDDTVLTEGDVS
jgi:sialic acid synthase SpsE